MREVRKVLILVIFCIALIVLNSCTGKEDNKLIGEWKELSRGTMLELSKDKYHIKFSGIDLIGEYYIEDGKIIGIREDGSKSLFGERFEVEINKDIPDQEIIFLTIDGGSLDGVYRKLK